MLPLVLVGEGGDDRKVFRLEELGRERRLIGRADCSTDA